MHTRVSDVHTRVRARTVIAYVHTAHGAPSHQLRSLTHSHHSDWVEDLPEPTKSEKEALIKSFGSPNVFTQFAPHVTVGYGA